MYELANAQTDVGHAGGYQNLTFLAQSLEDEYIFGVFWKASCIQAFIHHEGKLSSLPSIPMRYDHT